MDFKFLKLFDFGRDGGKKRAVLAGGVVLILLVFVGYTWNYYRQSANPNMHLASKTAQQNGKIKITPETNITQKIIYLKCWTEEVTRTKPSKKLIGMNFQELERNFPDWRIEKFDADEVEMTLETDTMCKEHANNTFIGIQDGYVAVFYGVPGPRAILKEVTNISLDKVMPEDLKEITSGLQIKSKEELLTTLEGMQER